MEWGMTRLKKTSMPPPTKCTGHNNKVASCNIVKSDVRKHYIRNSFRNTKLSCPYKNMSELSLQLTGTCTY